MQTYNRSGADTKAPEETVIFYGTTDVAKMLNCSVPTAREIMRRADFPLIMVGKSMKVSKVALEQWTMERHV